MTIVDFIIKEYPIVDRIKDKFADPYKLIKESDDFPYDKIGPDEYGQITKLIEIDDAVYYPVMEMISLTEGDARKMGNSFFEIWQEYISQIDLQRVNVADIMEAAKNYKQLRERRKEQANVLAVQEG